MGQANTGAPPPIPTTMLYSFENQHIDQCPAPAPAEPSDEQLMVDIQGGDERALGLLHRRYHALLRTVIGRVIGNDHDVDEIVQECLLEVWRRAANYDATKGQPLGWLVTLARRRAIDRLRRKTAYWRAQDRFRVETECEATTGMHRGADAEAEQGDTAQVVARLIANLPTAQQEAVRLSFFHGLSQRQIAAQTGIPLGTIKTRLELALRKLRASARAFGELREPLAAAA